MHLGNEERVGGSITGFDHRDYSFDFLQDAVVTLSINKNWLGILAESETKHTQKIYILNLHPLAGGEPILVWVCFPAQYLCSLIMSSSAYVLIPPQHAYHWSLPHQREIPPDWDDWSPSDFQVLDTRKDAASSPTPDNRANHRNVGAKIPSYALPKALKQGLRARRDWSRAFGDPLHHPRPSGARQATKIRRESFGHRGQDIRFLDGKIPSGIDLES